MIPEATTNVRPGIIVGRGQHGREARRLGDIVHVINRNVHIGGALRVTEGHTQLLTIRINGKGRNHVGSGSVFIERVARIAHVELESAWHSRSQEMEVIIAPNCEESSTARQTIRVEWRNSRSQDGGPLELQCLHCKGHRRGTGAE